MKKIILIFILLISGCVQTEPVDTPITTNSDSSEKTVQIEEEKNQENEAEKNETDKNKTEDKILLPQKALDTLDAIRQSLYTLSSAELKLGNHAFYLGTVTNTQIEEFLSLIEKSAIKDANLELNEKQNLNDASYLRLTFINEENHSKKLTYYYDFNAPILEFNIHDSVDIVLSADTKESIEEIFHLEDYYVSLDSEAMDQFEHEFIHTDDQMPLYGQYDNYFEVQQPMYLFRKGYSDYYVDEDLTPFHRVMNAYFYTGEFSAADALSDATFIYIMRTFPTLENLTGGYQLVDEIKVKMNGEIINLSLPEPLSGYTSFMPGDEFRDHYYELFDRDVPYDESHSWIESSQGYQIGYLNDSDMYLFYRYYDGATAGYSGWNLMINEQQLDGELLTLDVVKFYSSDVVFTQENTSINYPMIYKANWQPLTREESNYTAGISIQELIRNNLDEFERLRFTIKKRSDVSYALLSVERTSEEIPLGIVSGYDLYTVKRKRENKSAIENHTSDAVIIFNVTGNNVKSLNDNLYHYSQCADFDGFKIIEEDDRVIVELWCKCKFEGAEDEWFSYVSRSVSIGLSTFEYTLNNSR